jgi:hypothetical protein
MKISQLFPVIMTHIPELLMKFQTMDFFFKKGYKWKWLYSNCEWGMTYHWCRASMRCGLQAWLDCSLWYRTHSLVVSHRTKSSLTHWNMHRGKPQFSVPLNDEGWYLNRKVNQYRSVANYSASIFYICSLLCNIVLHSRLILLLEKALGWVGETSLGSWNVVKYFHPDTYKLMHEPGSLYEIKIICHKL